MENIGIFLICFVLGIFFIGLVIGSLIAVCVIPFRLRDLTYEVFKCNQECHKVAGAIHTLTAIQATANDIRFNEEDEIVE